MSGGHADKSSVKVWDLLVRTGHWTLVVCTIGAWLVHGKWHEWLGYCVFVVVVVRVAWGFTGSRYARFSQFLRTPSATLNYGRQVIAGHEPRHIGHNPLGGWMIATLLATLTGICFTGWLYTTDKFWGVAWVENLHEGLTNLLIALVTLHVAGVFFSSWRHTENLVAAMIHGRKRAAGPKDIT